MTSVPEPHCPIGRIPHRERVKTIDEVLAEGKIGAVVIDDTPDHIAWYLQELAKYPRLVVESHDVLLEGGYIIKVRKVAAPRSPT